MVTLTEALFLKMHKSGQTQNTFWTLNISKKQTTPPLPRALPYRTSVRLRSSKHLIKLNVGEMEKQWLFDFVRSSKNPCPIPTTKRKWLGNCLFPDVAGDRSVFCGKLRLRVWTQGLQAQWRRGERCFTEKEIRLNVETVEPEDGSRLVSLGGLENTWPHRRYYMGKK